MTYAQFLLVFLVPPLLILVIAFWRNPSEVRPWFAYGAGLLVLLALTYTTPWDNYLVATQVWNYPPERVLATIGYVPIEEYTFFILQTLVTSLWCYWLNLRLPIVEKPSGGLWLRAIGSVPLVIIWLASFWMLLIEPFRYFGLILVWATPVVLLQWCVAAPYLRNNKAIFFFSVSVPSAYLWAADLFAINDGIWSLSPTQTTGWHMFGLPVEEALFFLLTNVMVGQGLISFVAMRKQIQAWLSLRGVQV